MEVSMAGAGRYVITAAAAGALVLVMVPGMVTVAGQERFQFVVSASDAQGQPVTDIKPEEVVMSENGTANKIVKVEPFRIPVKLTIAVDNGPLSREPLAHYRSGLTDMVKALPAEVEVTLIATAPQPRMVVRPTTNRDQILRGINGFAPENERPRFTDALVEYSKRLQEELEDKKRIDSLPVLVMISTTANESASYEVAEVQKALGFLQARKAKVFVTMLAVRNTDAAFGSLNERREAVTSELAGITDLNTNRQALIAIPATKATGGRYEALAISNRLATLLPEFGQDITKLHNTHYNQLLVTAERAAGLKGPLQNPRIELARPGLTGQVSLDGLP
jgi:hypothetical protein